ncbi:hypothetical protein FRC11_012132, partial [Ceratobasidium sp. 423]
ARLAIAKLKKTGIILEAASRSAFKAPQVSGMSLLNPDLVAKVQSQSVSSEPEDEPGRRPLQLQRQRGVTKLTKRRNHKKKKLGPGRFADIPVDVLAEIALHLFPVDVIPLSRSNKFFRTIWMRRSSKNI